MQAGEGVVSRRSPHSVPETVDRLRAALEARGITLFATVDHSGEAEKAGLALRPTKLLIFGNPKAGTPMMVEAPTSALDLPLKALVWQDEGGQVWVSDNDPAYLQRRFGLSDEVAKGIAGVGALVEAALG